MPTHLSDPIVYIVFHSEDIAVKFAVKFVKSSKKVVFGPRLVGGRDIADFGPAFSNRTYFGACGRFWLSSVRRAPRVAGEKKIEEDRIAVKLKSTSMSGGLNMD